MTEKFEIPKEEDEVGVRTASNSILAFEAKHCRPHHLWPKAVKDIPDVWREAMEQYLFPFTDPHYTPAGEVLCLGCGDVVTGHGANPEDWKHKGKLNYAPDGTMEGRCVNCAYPCRLDHKIFLPNGQPLAHMQMLPLFYHPHFLQRRQ